tara:strand:+ start:17265 stop:18767 length:1503 start_codon:yes stop_codon:yes gene_type:complete
MSVRRLQQTYGGRAAYRGPVRAEAESPDEESKALSNAFKMTDAFGKLSIAHDKLADSKVEDSGLLTDKYSIKVHDEYGGVDTKRLFKKSSSRTDSIGMTGYIEDIYQPSYLRVKPDVEVMQDLAFSKLDEVLEVNPQPDYFGGDSEVFKEVLKNKDATGHEFAKKLYQLAEEDVIVSLSENGFNESEIAQIMDKNTKDIAVIPNLKKEKKELNSNTVEELIRKTSDADVVTKILDEIKDFKIKPIGSNSELDARNAFIKEGRMLANEKWKDAGINQGQILKDYESIVDYAKKNNPTEFGKSSKGLTFIKSHEDIIPTPEEFVDAYDNPELTKDIFAKLGMDTESNPILSDPNFGGLQYNDLASAKDITDIGIQAPDAIRNSNDILNESSGLLDDLYVNTQDFLKDTELGQKVQEGLMNASTTAKNVANTAKEVGEKASIITEPASEVMGAYDVVRKDASGWDRFTGAMDVAGAAGADANPIYAGVHIAVKTIDLLDDLLT